MKKFSAIYVSPDCSKGDGSKSIGRKMVKTILTLEYLKNAHSAYSNYSNILFKIKEFKNSSYIKMKFQEFYNS